MTQPVTLSAAITRTEATLDQAITEGVPLTMVTIASLQEAMIFWAELARQMEGYTAQLQAENANLRALLQMPSELSPDVFTGNVVPLGSAS